MCEYEERKTNEKKCIKQSKVNQKESRINIILLTILSTLVLLIAILAFVAGKSRLHRILHKTSTTPASQDASVSHNMTIPAEHAADMHRPKGYHENIGSTLALKLSISDDFNFKFSVVVHIPNSLSLEEVVKQANMNTGAAVEISSALPIDIEGDIINNNAFYWLLSNDEIVALAKNGAYCSYVGSGSGEFTDINWDTKSGINTYCELIGDMYVFIDNKIVYSPDVYFTN